MILPWPSHKPLMHAQQQHTLRGRMSWSIPSLTSPHTPRQRLPVSIQAHAAPAKRRPRQKKDAPEPQRIAKVWGVAHLLSVAINATSTAHQQHTTPPGYPHTQVLAHANITSRRKAEELVAQGVVQVNGETVTDVATHVLPSDKVGCAGCQGCDGCWCNAAYLACSIDAAQAVF